MILKKLVNQVQSGKKDYLPIEFEAYKTRYYNKIAHTAAEIQRPYPKEYATLYTKHKDQTAALLHKEPINSNSCKKQPGT